MCTKIRRLIMTNRLWNKSETFWFEHTLISCILPNHFQNIYIFFFFYTWLHFIKLLNISTGAKSYLSVMIIKRLIMINHWKLNLKKYWLQTQKSGSESLQTLWTSFRTLSLVRSLTFENRNLLRSAPAVFHILQQRRDNLFCYHRPLDP